MKTTSIFTRPLAGLFLGICVLSGAPVWCAPSLTINHLRCEDVQNPLGVEELHPRLSWQLVSPLRGAKQTVYRVLVASSPELLARNRGDLWDSGTVRSGATTQIVYRGRTLASNARCVWKVRVSDASGQTVESAPASWQMGLLHASDWHGQWIGCDVPRVVKTDLTPSLKNASWLWFPGGNPITSAPIGTRYFRKTFTLSPAQLQSARLRVAADNSAIISVNGKEIGRANNSWKSADSFDVQSALVAGANTIAISVANESDTAANVPNPAGLAAELKIQFENGQPLSILSDATWKSNDQPTQNWQNAAFDETNWKTAQVLAPVGQGPWGTVAQSAAPSLSGSPAPMLRRSFSLNGKIKRATAFICGLGYYEMSLNGRKVGDHMLDPGWTRYDRRSLYVAHDVTNYLQTGRNAIGVVLGSGHFDDHLLSVWDFDNATWRARPKMRLEMRVEYADGRWQTIVSDQSWKAANGPITFDSIAGGEHFDARLEKAGWNSANYQDVAWAPAQIVEPVKGILAAQIAPPVKVTQTIKPVKVTQPTPGVWIFDLGQNIAGVPEIRVSGAAGSKVVMRCAEKLHPDGTLDAANIDEFVRRRNPAEAFQTDIYTLKGKGREVWHPSFTYHGFQYVEVKGFPGTPTLDNLRGLVMHSAFDKIGSFSCSNEVLNRTQQNSVWSYRNNFHSIPTDCPHREKNGWTGDAHLAAEMGLYNFDGAANYEKWLDDIADEQKPDGSYAGIIPTSGWGYDIGPSWDSAYPLIVWYLYEYRGDKTVVEKHYPRLQRYLNFLSTRAKNGIVDYGLGDWVPPKTKTASDVTSTAYYYVDATLLSQMAQLLGKTEDAKKYSALAASIKTAFNAKFYNPQTHLYANGSLAAQSCALFQGLVEERNKPAVVEALVAEVKKQNYHMDVGILGAKYLLNTLTDNGRADVAYRILQQKTWPSYGFWIDQGATTLWEEWNGNQSRNHVMFGDVSAWFYKYLAGIRPASPGFKTLVLQPHILGDLTSARATYDSMQGCIVSDWKIEKGVFKWQVTIPANTSATVMVPCVSASKLTESGLPIAKAVGIKFLRQQNGHAVFAAQSGTYHFACPAPKRG